MMQQYQEMKEQYPDSILLFQLGDFYETFYDDAALAARELDITLTARDGIPMAGIPVRKAELYVQRLLRRGHRVALCPQVEQSGKGQTLLRRRVTRVLTPGTVLEEEGLHPEQDTLLAALFPEEGRAGVAWVEAASGQFAAEEIPQAQLADVAARLEAQEWLFPEGCPSSPELTGALTYRPLHVFDGQKLQERFPGVLPDAPLAARAAGALVTYLDETVGELPHLRPPALRDESDHMLLDAFTQRSLELTAPLREEGGPTLLSVLDHTTTSMGRRLLRRWILSPLRKIRAIQERMDVVEALVEGGDRRSLKDELARCCDMPRLTGRAGLGRLMPPDLAAIRSTLESADTLRQELQTMPSPPGGLTKLTEKLQAAPGELVNKIAGALVDDPPRDLESQPVIRQGCDRVLDETLARAAELRRQIANLEATERKRTHIGNLRVRYNKVLGYFFEVSQGQLSKVPQDWRRRQQLTGGERFTSQTLDGLADELLAAESSAADRQRELLQELYECVQENLENLAEVGAALAELDVLRSLATLVRRRGYKRPSFNSEGSVRIAEGRHPVVETAAEFVPNDLVLDPGQRLAVVTGPNMAGKSVYLRQVALITLLAQMGSFVPAQEAVLPVFDRVYTRVGASDAVADGLSTFMAEMQEAASILSGATEHSLVILDELGRGTSTHDGMSLAWSIARFLAHRVHCMTLFATHYRELAALADELPGVVNLHTAVREWQGRVVFLHRVLPGVAERSYGVHVARLAQLPEEILREAERLLARLEHGGGPAAPAGLQLPLFGPQEHPAVARLREVDPETLTPLEALKLLTELKTEFD
ncbi:MAG: DNA mismatch repair protein MutS [Candidatus Bipolaricaulota bacterium]